MVINIVKPTFKTLRKGIAQIKEADGPSPFSMGAYKVNVTGLIGFEDLSDLLNDSSPEGEIIEIVKVDRNGIIAMPALDLTLRITDRVRGLFLFDDAAKEVLRFETIYA